MDVAIEKRAARSAQSLRSAVSRRARRWLALPLMLVLSTGCSVWGGKPANVVDGFIRAVRARDYESAIEAISPEVRDKMREAVSELTSEASAWASSKYEIVENELNGESAVVSVEFIEGKPGGSGGDPVRFGTRQRLRFYMVKKDNRWYIEAISN